MYFFAKTIFFLVLFFLYLVFSSKVLAASVVINEFSSNNGTDWVEIYNISSDIVDLSQYHLEDNSGNSQSLSCNLDKYGYYSVDWSNRLNNEGDKIILLKDSNIIDCVSYGSGPACSESVDLGKLEGGEYGAREPEGSGSWLKKTSSSKASNSDCIAISSPSPSPSPSSSPESNSSATCKVNNVKDKDGNILSSVKIYVDGNYVHHYASETLTFCDDCQCYEGIDCHFGEHTIKLEKSGYQDWSEKRTLNAGDHWDINAIMTPSESNPSPSPSSTPKTTTTTKKAATASVYKKESASSEEMLSDNQEIEIGEVMGASETEEENQEEEEAEPEKPFLMPLIISGGGLLLLSGAAFPFVKPKILEFIKKRKLKKPSPDLK